MGIIQQNFESNSEIKTHDEISDLIDSVKHVEENFSNIGFLQDLPEMVEFTNKPVAEPEIPINSIQKEDQTPEKSVEIPDQIKVRQPKKIQIPKILNIQRYLHNHLLQSLISPPEPGHTTFTIELQDQTVTGFHQANRELRSIKELGPIIKNKLKTIVQTIKEGDLKNNMKNIKNVPSLLKKQVLKINVNALKSLPTKLRGLFSSD